MGGRGSSGISKIGGVSLDFNGKTITYYFSDYGGKHYYRNDLAKIPEPTPNNMTAKKFIATAKKNGAIVNKTYSVKTVNQMEEKRNKERASRPDYEFGLGKGVDNRNNRRAARRNRLSDRAQKRR